MEQTKKMFFAIISGILIILISLVAAYVCFHILESSANADLKEWKLGGAFAGFIFTALTALNIALQIFKSINAQEIPKLEAKIADNEKKLEEKVADYEKQLKEMQLKLIRGAVCPSGYIIDIDEHHKLVFVRPEKWTSMTPVLYQYVDKTGANKFAANFNVTHHDKADIFEFFPGFRGTEDDIEELYKECLKPIEAGFKDVYPDYNKKSFSTEYIIIDEIKSIKYLHSYSAAVNAEGDIETITQIGEIIYVDKLKSVFIFTFTDEANNFLKSSEIFTHITNSIRFL